MSTNWMPLTTRPPRTSRQATMRLVSNCFLRFRGLSACSPSQAHGAVHHRAANTLRCGLLACGGKAEIVTTAEGDLVHATHALQLTMDHGEGLLQRINGIDAACWRDVHTSHGVELVQAGPALAIDQDGTRKHDGKGAPLHLALLIVGGDLEGAL